MVTVMFRSYNLELGLCYVSLYYVTNKIINKLCKERAIKPATHLLMLYVIN